MRSRTGPLTFVWPIRAASLSFCTFLYLAAPPLHAQTLFGWQDFERAFDRAHAAQAAGDCVAFDRHIGDLRELDEEISLEERKTNAVWVNAPSFGRSADKRKQTIRQLVAEGCPKPTTIAGPRGTLYQAVKVDVDLNANKVTLPTRRFLGSEVVGSFQPQVGLFTPNDEGDGTGVSATVKIDMTNFFNLPFGQNPPKTSFMRFGINHSEFDVKQSIGSIDPGANTNLLIPGPLGGASGFSLGANPLNIVTGAQYGVDYSETGYVADLGIESFYPMYRTHLEGYVRGFVSDVRFNETFSGMIPGFNRDFAYGTHVDATRYGVGVGVTGRTSIAQFSTPGVQDYWDVALRYAGEFGGFRVNGDGTDSLSFTGFQTSTAQLDASDSGYYYKLGAGLEVSAGPMKSYVMFGYENTPAVPVIVRDGNNPSQLTFDDGNVWSVKFGVNVGFGGGPQLANGVR